jgi:hypothetical protein
MLKIQKVSQSPAMSEVILFISWDIKQTTKNLPREDQRAPVLLACLIREWFQLKYASYCIWVPRQPESRKSIGEQIERVT